jgi:hypothetical protein
MVDGEYFLFRWSGVPGSDSIRLRDHLEKGLKLGWAKRAEISKSVDNETVTVTDGINTVTLSLDTERNRVVLKVGGGETHEYILRRDNRKLDVYAKEVGIILREIDSDDDEALETLAKNITENSWKDPRDVVELLHSGDEEDSSKAAAVLLSMEDTPLTPLLDALSSDIPEDYVWDMETIVNIQLENRVKIAKALEQILKDKRYLKPPELPPGTEETPVARRVCDAAYLLMRQLLAFEDEEDQMLNSDEFLGMTEEEKDAEISRAKASKKWLPLANRIYEDEE